MSLCVNRPIPAQASGYWTFVTIQLLALVPFLGILVGARFFNRVTPLVFAILGICVGVATVAVMALNNASLATLFPGAPVLVRILTSALPR